jgi:hypothetical protein
VAAAAVCGQLAAAVWPSWLLLLLADIKLKMDAEHTYFQPVHAVELLLGQP